MWTFGLQEKTQPIIFLPFNVPISAILVNINLHHMHLFCITVLALFLFFIFLFIKLNFVVGSLGLCLRGVLNAE